MCEPLTPWHAVRWTWLIGWWILLTQQTDTECCISVKWPSTPQTVQCRVGRHNVTYQSSSSVSPTSCRFYDIFVLRQTCLTSLGFCVMMVLHCAGSTSILVLWLYWFYIKLVLHQNGSTSNWFYIKMVIHQTGSTSHWFYIKMVIHQNGSISKWFYIKLVLHQNGSTSKWFYIKLVLHQNGYTSKWFYFKLVLHYTYSAVRQVLHCASSTAYWLYPVLVLHQTSSTSY